jgi:uncharacterized repeat protein (TIGR03803 family)
LTLPKELKPFKDVEIKAHSQGFHMKTNRNWSRGQLLVGCIGVLLFCLTAGGAVQSYSILHHFTAVPPDGYLPEAALILSGETLYGTTFAGMDSAGTIFKINTDGSGYTILKKFQLGEGSAANARLVLEGPTLYGTTSFGGSSNRGSIFRIDIDGGNFAVLKQFPELWQGASPFAGLAVSGTTLYGTTKWGGIGQVGFGTLFKINTDGSGFIVLKHFMGSDGSHPSGDLLLEGSTLFGTTEIGGSSNQGTVFRMNTDGSDYTVLKSFTGQDGAYPWAGLALSGTTLYGTTEAGGSSNRGTVFSVDVDGGGYKVLKHFSGNDGASPRGVLYLSGKTLYGGTRHGGISMPFGQDGGTIFRLNTDGSGFAVLKYFSGGSDGQNPGSGPVLSGSRLYGTTQAGGNFNNGVVFALGLTPTILRPPLNRTAETGSSVDFVVRAIPSELSYQWRLNDNCIVGATNSSLGLTNILFGQSGSYTVVITNAFGAVTSGPAMLQVIPPVERRLVPAINLGGETGSVVSVEYVNSISPAPGWLLLDTVSLASTSQLYFDLTKSLPPQRLYRASQPRPPFRLVPTIGVIGMVPAITLTGEVSRSLRVDGIYPIGPTDAWFTLDTVTLTNTTQLYFDVSAHNQPTRLYRVTPLP